MAGLTATRPARPCRDRRRRPASRGAWIPRSRLRQRRVWRRKSGRRSGRPSELALPRNARSVRDWFLPRSPGRPDSTSVQSSTPGADPAAPMAVFAGVGGGDEDVADGFDAGLAGGLPAAFGDRPWVPPEGRCMPDAVGGTTVAGGDVWGDGGRTISAWQCVQCAIFPAILGEALHRAWQDGHSN